MSITFLLAVYESFHFSISSRKFEDVWAFICVTIVFEMLTHSCLTFLYFNSEAYEI